MTEDAPTPHAVRPTAPTPPIGQPIAVPADSNAGVVPIPDHPSLLGDTLAPILRRICGDRLGEVRWFRTDWQRGGALTGYADWTLDAGVVCPAVVKLPVPPQELAWLGRLTEAAAGGATPVAPTLYAGGQEVGPYDFAWAVMQRMPHGPLDAAWNGHEVDLLLDAAARFYAAAELHPCDRPPRDENWPHAIRRARAAVREHALPEDQRWNAALKALGKKLKKLLAVWDQRDTGQWCHGDLHFGNAMTAAPPPDGPAVLFDLALVHAGHWVEDAAYFEHLFWSAPGRLGEVDVVKRLSAARKSLGLSVEASWPRLANIRRLLLAAAAPLDQAGQPRPAHLHASLVKLERLLAAV